MAPPGARSQRVVSSAPKAKETKGRASIRHDMTVVVNGVPDMIMLEGGFGGWSDSPS